MLGNKGTGKNYRDGGCRGGADQFNWESVKSDAYRENYLGHSVSAPVGKWQMGKDILWYQKKMGEKDVGQNSRIQNRDEVRRREIAAIKALEDDLLNEGLGLAPKRRRTGKELDSTEMAQLLERGQSERDRNDIERVGGLGAAPSKRHDHVPKQTLMEKQAAAASMAAYEAEIYGHGGGGGADGGGGEGRDGRDSGDRERDRKTAKREKKERKKEKKREKKAKKEAKKEKKAKKEDRRDDDRDRDRRDDRDRDRRDERDRHSRKRSRSDSRNRSGSPPSRSASRSRSRSRSRS